MAKDHPTGNSGLYRAFLQLKTPEECYRFLQDVCSYSELSAMEQRYNIAELLADKCIYTEIMDKTGASSAIISRVSRVLSADDSVLRALLEAEKSPLTDTKAAYRPKLRHAAFLLRFEQEVFLWQKLLYFCGGHRGVRGTAGGGSAPPRQGGGAGGKRFRQPGDPEQP